MKRLVKVRSSHLCPRLHSRRSLSLRSGDGASVGDAAAAAATRPVMGNSPAGACLAGAEEKKETAFSMNPLLEKSTLCNEESGDSGRNGTSDSCACSNARSGATPDAKQPDRSPRRRKSLRHLQAPDSNSINGAVGSTIRRLLKGLEAFLFPDLTLGSNGHRRDVIPSTVRRGVLLHGCSTPEEQYAKIKESVDRVGRLRGEDGLRALGFEYRLLPCANHTPTERPDEDRDEADETKPESSKPACQVGLFKTFNPTDSEDSLREEEVAVNDVTFGESLNADHISDNQYLNSLQQNLYSESVRSVCSGEFMDMDDILDVPESDFGPSPRCMLCMRRLYHCETNTLITRENRKSYIADGEMYELVARLCQDYAHDIMCQEGKLEWVLIDSNVEAGEDPVRVLINSDHPCLRRLEEWGDDVNEMVNRPTLLIATGRGKVRAGIFSREHLIGSGMEMATALPVIREALRRKLNIIIPDHNVHGDANGFISFEKTLDFITSRLHGQKVGSFIRDSDSSDQSTLASSQREVYILAHSASGGHLSRYLLEKQEHFIPYIRAIAFTDSTHNIQWSKRQNIPELTKLLESDKCVYFRSSKAREQEDNSLWYLHRSGEPILTDEFWKHRFGNIKTFWAGTNEHSLTNWYAHTKIWQHFDDFLTAISSQDANAESSPDANISESQRMASEELNSDDPDVLLL